MAYIVRGGSWTVVARTAKEALRIQGDLVKDGSVEVTITDMDGRRILSEQLTEVAGAADP